MSLPSAVMALMYSAMTRVTEPPMEPNCSETEPSHSTASVPMVMPVTAYQPNSSPAALADRR